MKYTAIQLPENEGGSMLLAKDARQEDLKKWESWGCVIHPLNATEEGEAVEEFKALVPDAGTVVTGQFLQNIKAGVLQKQ